MQQTGAAKAEPQSGPSEDRASPRGWISFWNSENSIYVSARHREVHFRTIADDIAAYVPSSDAVVLDYGCGEALAADRVAARAGRLILSDAAPAVRERLAQRFAGNARIAVRAPEELAGLGGGALDLMVVNSVSQYLTAEELDRLLALARGLLKPGGRLVVGDVVPPTHSTVAAVWALLRFAAQNGFLLAAIAGLARTALSEYRTLRMKIGLTTYDECARRGRLEAAGFAARRADKNIGHNPARMTFVATRR